MSMEDLKKETHEKHEAIGFARKRNRLKGYDYSQQGAYFVTICAKDLQELFGAIAMGELCIAHPALSRVGTIVEAAIENIPQIYPDVEIDRYVIMPNHIHMIIILDQADADKNKNSKSIPSIMRSFKTMVTKDAGESFWQASYHDHIIRNEADYQRIWQYIDNNPATWADDCYYS